MHAATGPVDANHADPRVDRMRRRLGRVSPQHFDRAVRIDVTAIVADEDFPLAGPDLRRFEPRRRLLDRGGDPLEGCRLPRGPLSGRIRVVDHRRRMRVRGEEKDLLDAGRLTHPLADEVHRLEPERPPQIERHEGQPMRPVVEQQHLREERIALPRRRPRPIRIPPQVDASRRRDVGFGGRGAKLRRSGNRRQIDDRNDSGKQQRKGPMSNDEFQMSKIGRGGTRAQAPNGAQLLRLRHDSIRTSFVILHSSFCR